MPAQLCRTKIVATLGPATATAARVAALIKAGVDVFRLNFSHGSHEQHAEYIRLVRAAEAEAGTTVGILQDVQGLKIRLGEVAPGGVTLKPVNRFLLICGEAVADETRGSVSYERLCQEVPVGTVILMDEGRLQLLVEEVTPAHLVCRVVAGGALRRHMGVNFPGVTLSIGALTDKDRGDIAFGARQGVDWLAISFVQRAHDIAEARRYLHGLGASLPIVAKIEKQEGVNAIAGILNEADAIMVARGDLGVETPLEEVPLVQKRLIALCNAMGKPVITATQMLDSMVHAPRPTRAEASDVANAILDGTDALMLSNETAIGEYPLEAVETMVRIARRTERALRQRLSDGEIDFEPTSAISAASCQIARLRGARAILTATHTGATCQQVAKHRPFSRIIAATPLRGTCRKLSLVWGVIPLLIGEAPSTDEMTAMIVREAAAAGLVQPGDVVVVTAGVPLGQSGTTNLIKVETVQ